MAVLAPAPAVERIVIGLGEKVTLKSKDLLKGNKALADRLKDENCYWHLSTGSVVVAASDQDFDEKVELVGAHTGRALVSFGPHLADRDVGDRMRFADSASLDHVSVEVEVVDKKKEEAEAESPLATSSVHADKLPMDEVQEEPSAATPYGMDQENKPVAPHPSMSAGDDSSVARETDDGVKEDDKKTTKKK